MFWPFKTPSRSGSPSRRTIETIYGMIVAQAREPAFYRDFAVPDTVNGRFDMVVLHLWMVLRRLREDAATTQSAQALVDHFASDMDDNLREIGTADLRVPKKVLAFGEALYGRAKAYDSALDDGDAARLAQALSRNIYNGLENDSTEADAPRLAVYVRRQLAALAAADIVDLAAGRWQFAAPHRE